MAMKIIFSTNFMPYIKTHCEKPQNTVLAGPNPV